MNRVIKFRSWDEFPKYEIGSDGSVMSLDYNHTGKRKELRQYLDKDGYPYVFMVVNGRRYKRMVHKLVAISFIIIPESRKNQKLQVNHKNGIRNDNQLENLEWMTSRENTIDGWKRGRKISDEQREKMSLATKRYNCKRWHKNKKCVCNL